MTDLQAGFWDFGTQSITVEAPDVIVLRLNGTVELASCRRVSALLKELAEKRPFFLITDFTGMKDLSPDVRKEISESVKPEWILGCAYIKAAPLVRMAVAAINIVMFFAGKTTFETHFASTEEEARSAIDRMKQKRIANAA